MRINLKKAATNWGKLRTRTSIIRTEVSEVEIELFKFQKSIYCKQKIRWDWGKHTLLTFLRPTCSKKQHWTLYFTTNFNQSLMQIQNCFTIPATYLKRICHPFVTLGLDFFRNSNNKQNSNNFLKSNFWIKNVNFVLFIEASNSRHGVSRSID